MYWVGALSEDLGFLLALASGVFFAFGDVFVRLASVGLSPRVNQLISLIIGTPFITLLALSFSGLPSVTPEPLVLYVGAGLLTFALGRVLFFACIAFVGASTSSTIVTLTIPLAALWAWVLLGEVPSVGDLIGLGLVSAAAVLASREPSGEVLQGGSRLLGVAAGITATVTFSLSSSVVRVANSLSGDPLWGLVASYLAALPASLAYSMREFRRLNLPELSKYLRFMVAGTLSTSTAQALRYVALSVIPVASVAVMIGLFPVYVVFLSRVVLRGEGRERPKVVHGVAAVMAVAGVLSTVLA